MCIICEQDTRPSATYGSARHICVGNCTCRAFSSWFCVVENRHIAFIEYICGIVYMVRFLSMYVCAKFSSSIQLTQRLGGFGGGGRGEGRLRRWFYVCVCVCAKTLSASHTFSHILIRRVPRYIHTHTHTQHRDRKRESAELKSASKCTWKYINMSHSIYLYILIDPKCVVFCIYVCDICRVIVVSSQSQALCGKNFPNHPPPKVHPRLSLHVSRECSSDAAMWRTRRRPTSANKS